MFSKYDVKLGIKISWTIVDGVQPVDIIHSLDTYTKSFSSKDWKVEKGGDPSAKIIQDTMTINVDSLTALQRILGARIILKETKGGTILLDNPISALIKTPTANLKAAHMSVNLSASSTLIREDLYKTYTLVELLVKSMSPMRVPGSELHVIVEGQTPKPLIGSPCYILIDATHAWDFCMSKRSITFRVRDESNLVLSEGMGIELRSLCSTGKPNKSSSLTPFLLPLLPPTRGQTLNFKQLPLSLKAPFAEPKEWKLGEIIEEANRFDGYVSGSVCVYPTPRPLPNSVTRLSLTVHSMGLNELIDNLKLPVEGIQADRIHVSGFISTFHHPFRVLVVAEGDPKTVQCLAQRIKQVLPDARLLFDPTCMWSTTIYPTGWFQKILVRRLKAIQQMHADGGLNRMIELQQAKSIWQARDSFPTDAEVIYVASHFGETVESVKLGRKGKRGSLKYDEVVKTALETQRSKSLPRFTVATFAFPPVEEPYQRHLKVFNTTLRGGEERKSTFAPTNWTYVGSQ